MWTGKPVFGQRVQMVVVSPLSVAFRARDVVCARERFECGTILCTPIARRVC